MSCPSLMCRVASSAPSHRCVCVGGCGQHWGQSSRVLQVLRGSAGVGCVICRAAQICDGSPWSSLRPSSSRQAIMRQPALLLHDQTIAPSTYDKEAISQWLSEHR